MLMYKAKTTGKRPRAECTAGDADNVEIGPKQHARQDTPGPKKRPPHRLKGPRIVDEAAKVTRGSGEGLGTPSPGHGAASGEVKATTSRTPPHPTGLVSPLMEERREGTRTRIEKESINGPKGESSSMQDSSLDPTAPLPPPPWAESTRGKELEGLQPPDDPPERTAETRSPDPEEPNPFTLIRLQTSIANLQSQCEGSLEHVGLLLSEIAQYPLPPTVAVVKKILGFENDTETQLFPELFTTSQLSTAILDSDDNITPQWYIEPLERHVQLQHATTVMNDIGPKLKTWYESTDGVMESAGLLLAELAPEPDRGNPFPNGMAQLLLRTEKGAQKFQNTHGPCLARSLDVQDTTASISQISEELLPPTDQVETNHFPCPDNAWDRGSGGAAAYSTGADDTDNKHSHIAAGAVEDGAPHGTGHEVGVMPKEGDTGTRGAPATAKGHETANGDIGVAQHMSQDIGSAQTNEGGDETDKASRCGHLIGNENDHKTEHKAADTDSAESKCKDNDASHDNGAEPRRRVIGTEEQSDASRSQAPQGAGDETGMARCTETTPSSAVVQLTEDGGGLDSIPVGIGRVKAEGASSKPCQQAVREGEHNGSPRGRREQQEPSLKIQCSPRAICSNTRTDEHREHLLP